MVACPTCHQRPCVCLVKTMLASPSFRDDQDTLLLSKAGYEFFTKSRRFSTKSAARKLVAALWFTAQETAGVTTDVVPNFRRFEIVKTRNPTKG